MKPRQEFCLYFEHMRDNILKKILVLSDSHGNVNNMITAVVSENPDMVIHLGDCETDAYKLEKRFPELQIEQVPGNCDYEEEFCEKIIEIEGKKLLLCHGHTYNVKCDYLRLEMAAIEKGMDMALFGHTHKVFYDHHNGLRMMNPGSIGAPPYGVPASYGLLYFDDSADIKMEIKYLS